MTTAPCRWVTGAARMRSSRRVGFKAAASALAIGLVCQAATFADFSVRVPWTSSRVTGRPEPPPPYQIQRIHPGISFRETTLLEYQPLLGRFFVGERLGKIYALPRDREGSEPSVFFDGAESVARLNRGRAAGDQLRFESLFGMAFDPDFAQTRYCYICYTVKRVDSSGKLGPEGDQLPDGSRVVRMRVRNEEPPVCDPDSEELVISWMEGGHNGGCLRFGPDGCLYISTGDASDPYPPDMHKAGQDLSTLLSKVLRLEVRGGQADQPYAIPPDNPFVGMPAARGEIWAYGLRNPWKMSFDRLTGELWVGDVGWELWELVHNVHRGQNFGWSIVEGRQPVNQNLPRGPTPIVPPVLEIPHTEAASITGGFVYRGRKFPELAGSYIFGDWETRRIWSAKVDDGRLGDRREIVDPLVRIVDFAEDAEGELYLLDHDDGAIYTLAVNDAVATSQPFPQTLSATGLFSSVADHTPAPGVVSFEINAEQWSDHAVAERLLGVPGSDAVAVRGRPMMVPGTQFARSAIFPRDAVLVKTLSLDMAAGDAATRRRIETQLLHFDGHDWRGYTYEWNDDQTDAALVDREGQERVFEIKDPASPDGRRKQVWRFHSRAECLRCHNPWAGHALAFNLHQLNRPVGHPDGTVNQITALASAGFLVDDMTPQKDDPFVKLDVLSDIEKIPRLVPPFDPQENIDARARAYLHVNCGHCHRFGGGGSTRLYLDFRKKLRDTLAVGTPPSQGSFGIDNAEIITPGDPFRSVLYYRLSTTGPGHMPHIGAREVDNRGLALVHDWIRQIPVRFADTTRLERLVELNEPGVLAWERTARPTLEWRALGENATTADDQDRAAAREEIDKRFARAAVDREATRRQLAGELLSTPASALLVLEALRRDTLPPEIVSLVMEIALGSEVSPTVNALFEQFLPESERPRRLGESFDPEAVLCLSGDVLRGEHLFHTSTVVQCRNCHRIGERGGDLGPPLDGVGRKFDRAKLLDAIIYPSREIDPRYAGWLVQTTTGNVHVGLLEERTEEAIVLLDAGNQRHRIPTDEIEQLVRQQKSLMPEMQLRDFTTEQAADLLAYLASLRADPPPGIQDDDGP